MLRISTHRNITHQGVETMFVGLYSQYLWQKIPKIKNDGLLFEILQFLMVKSEFCPLFFTTAWWVLDVCSLANQNKQKHGVSSSQVPHSPPNFSIQIMMAEIWTIFHGQIMLWMLVVSTYPPEKYESDWIIIPTSMLLGKMPIFRTVISLHPIAPFASLFC